MTEKRSIETSGEAEAGNSRTSLIAQGSVVAGMTLLSRISGLVRDIFLSYLLGSTQHADMFLVAFRIPNFFRRMFAEGAFSQSFIPVMTRYKLQGQAQLLAFLAPLTGLFTSGLIVFTVLGLLFAEPLTYLFAPGFAEHPDRLAETAELVRITLPYLALISLTAYAGALLNAHGRFAVPAGTPILLNLVLIGAALVAMANTGERSTIEILSWGVLAAGVVQLLFQLPSLGRLGLVVFPSMDHRHEGIRRWLRLFGPALFAGSVSQINAVVNTILASTLITGSISWLYYADRLLELPVGLVAIALSTVMLPHLSRLAAEGNEAEFRGTLGWGINLGLMLGLPAALALYLLADGLIATLFLSIGGSQMTVQDARMAGYALQMFAVALPGFVLLRILAPAFYAHENTKDPFRYAGIAVVANIVTSLATYTWFGHVGLAWATAVSAWTNVILLYAGLVRRGLFRINQSLWGLFWRTIIACVVLALALWFYAVPIQWLEIAAERRMLLMLLVCGVGGVGYLILLMVLGVRPRHLRQYSARPTETV